MSPKTKITTVLLMLLCAALPLIAGGQQEVEQPAEDARVIVDMRGNEIVLPAEGATFGVFGGPISLTPYLFGVQEDVIAVTKGPQNMKLMQQMDPKLTSKPAPRTTNGNINVEELLMADPDCVIAFETDGEIVADHTEIPVIFLTGSMGDGFAAMKSEVQFFGGVFQNPEKADAYCKYLDDTLAFIDERLSDISEDEYASVYLGEGMKHLAILGGDTFMNEWLAAAHCKNASFDIMTAAGKEDGLHSGFREISMEQVLAADPEIIIINEGAPADLTDDARWNEIKAVKDERVYMAPGGLFIWSRPSIESAVLYPLWLATHVYPQYFEDYSLEDEYIRFYKELFDFEVNAETAQAVISGTAAKNFKPF